MEFVQFQSKTSGDWDKVLNRISRNEKDLTAKLTPYLPERNQLYLVAGAEHSAIVQEILIITAIEFHTILFF